MVEGTVIDELYDLMFYLYNENKGAGEELAAVWELLQDITKGQGIETVFVLSINGVLEF